MSNVSWEFSVRYKKTVFKLTATVEYYSTQVIRIRVDTGRSTMLLETNYAAIYHKPSKIGAITWKIKQGIIKEGTPDSAALFVDIFSHLEHNLKKDIKKIFPDPPLLFED